MQMIRAKAFGLAGLGANVRDTNGWGEYDSCPYGWGDIGHARSCITKHSAWLMIGRIEFGLPNCDTVVPNGTEVDAKHGLSHFNREIVSYPCQLSRPRSYSYCCE